MRSVIELTNDTSAWPLLLQKIVQAKNKIEILPVFKGKNREAIYQTQVTTHSYMGAVIYFTGGILIDNGWIRILGSGSEKLNRSLPEWNKGKTFKEFGENPPFLLIGDDAIGGFFAINGGAFGDDKGKVYYLSPDSLNWKPLDFGYSDFLDFCLNGDLDTFYKQSRWREWKTDIIQLKGDEAFSFYPFLWSKEGKDIEKDKRSIVPIKESYIYATEARKQLMH